MTGLHDRNVGRLGASEDSVAPEFTARMTKRGKKPREDAPGLFTPESGRSVAAVARPGFTLQIEPNLRVRIGAEKFAALIHHVALIMCGVTRAVSGQGRRSDDSDCEKKRSDDGLHDTSPWFELADVRFRTRPQ
jgi:hypothetical protein